MLPPLKAENSCGEGEAGLEEAQLPFPSRPPQGSPGGRFQVGHAVAHLGAAVSRVSVSGENQEIVGSSALSAEEPILPVKLVAEVEDFRGAQ